MSYATRPFAALPAASEGPGWRLQVGLAAMAGLALGALLWGLSAALQRAEYESLRAQAGILYCADVPERAGEMGRCRDYACLERRAADLGGRQDELIKFAVRCDRVLDPRGE